MTSTISVPNRQTIGGNTQALCDAVSDQFAAAVVDIEALQLGTTLPAFKARGTLTSLAAYTTTSGVITADANGAIGTQDGLTLVANDVVVMPPGVAVAAAEAGPWVVTTVGTAGSKFVLTRPTWWPHAGTVGAGQTVDVAAGTTFAGTRWKVYATAAITVGTTDPSFYPEKVNLAATLVAGHKAITSVPIRSATLTNYTIVRKTANTCAATDGGYHPLSITAGGLGTATVDITACVLAGTINVADVSTMIVTIHN